MFDRFIVCKECGSLNTLSVKDEGFIEWVAGGVPIETALPMLTRGEAHLLTKQVCEDCSEGRAF